jgi:Fe2+ transport system protein B
MEAPLVISLNQIDIAKKKGIVVNKKNWSRR